MPVSANPPMPEGFTKDGCTLFFDGAWRHCCDLHDWAYVSGHVDLQSHLDLGYCVAHTGGGPLIGGLMALATTVWWLARPLWIKRSSSGPRPPTDSGKSDA